MSKITLTNLVNLQNETTAVNAINANNTALTTALDNTLSRDGTSPNTMSASLDMNSNRVYNLPTPIASTEAARLQDLATLNGSGTLHSIPSGGTTGQVLAKTSNTSYDANWSTTGGGTVTSVALALPADFTVTGSPVTGTGTLTGSWALTPSGTGSVLRQTSPTLVTPLLGTPTSGVATNLTGTAAGLTAGSVTTVPASAMPAHTGDVTTSAGAVATTIANNAVTNAKAAQMAAYTIKGNSTGSTANSTDISIPALTQKVTPAGADFVMIADSAASNALKYATVASIGTSAGVSSIAGNTGAFTLTKGITNATNAIGRALNEATLQTTIANPTGTTSTTGLMQGLGSTWALTPTYSTRIKYTLQGCLSNTTGGTNSQIAVRYGTGAAPANAAALTGTTIGSAIIANMPNAGNLAPVTMSGLITGLTAGTAYWLDLSMLSGSGAATASISQIYVTLEEF